MTYKEDKKYLYNKRICNQCYEFWMYDECLSFNERKYFYDLMLECKYICEKIKNNYINGK